MGLPSLPTALMMGGAAINAYGQMQSGKEEAASIMAQNAITQQQGRYREARMREDTARLRGSQRVAVAKSGVMFEGSPLDVIARSAEDAELEAQALRWGLKTSDAVARADASNARRAGAARAIGSLLTGTAGALSLSGKGNFKAPGKKKGFPSPGKSLDPGSAKR